MDTSEWVEICLSLCGVLIVVLIIPVHFLWIARIALSRFRVERALMYLIAKQLVEFDFSSFPFGNWLCVWNWVWLVEMLA
jgi:hypothetical protein